MTEQARLTDFGVSARVQAIAEKGREAVREQGVTVDAP